MSCDYQLAVCRQALGYPFLPNVYYRQVSEYTNESFGTSPFLDSP